MDNSVAIVASFAAGISCVPLAVGKGFVAVRWREYVLVGVYFSPNKTLSEFERFLDDMVSIIGQFLPQPAIVLGDFNSKSVAWGSPRTDARGRVLEEWAATLGLVLLNTGSVNTCVRRNGGSIVDLSFASPLVACRIRDWRVVEEMETLSDHLYICFNLSSSSLVTANERSSARRTSSTFPRWSLTALNREAMIVASIAQSWMNPPEGPLNADVEAQWFKNAMTRICDAAMPRSKPQSPRRQVYWWSQEITTLRSNCIAARRQYTRHLRRRLRNRNLDDDLYNEYRRCTVELQIAIRTAKERSRIDLLETINVDPWGRPYKMVRNKLTPWAPPLTETLQPQLLDGIVRTLFPASSDYLPPFLVPPRTGEGEESEVPSVSESELSAAVCKLRRKNKAPGPDGIPGRIWVTAIEFLGDRLRALFDVCLNTGRFPLEWKCGKLVLLRKEGRPEESPSAYRPIIMLNEGDKLFERVIADRLTKHLDNVGPNLSQHQFGFRAGRSTIDAILSVKVYAKEIMDEGGVLLAVSLDIANAFNTLPWACIIQALTFHGVPHYLINIITAYLSDRCIVYTISQGEVHRTEMSCGVPQGSVLGPLLWNIGYDWVLRSELSAGARMVCYADDTLVMAKGRTYQEAAVLATDSVAQVVRRIQLLGLGVALEKTEVICFHGPRRSPPRGSYLIIGGVHVEVEPYLKYLGLTLDSRWNFQEHFARLSPRLVRTAAALKRLLPNVDGPNTTCRRLYLGVVRSMALYGAPIFVDALTGKITPYLRRPQRILSIGAVRGYRTISYEAASLLAGSPPWDLEAEVFAARYEWRQGLRLRGEHPAPREVNNWMELAKQALFDRWNERLTSPRAGNWTVGAVRPFLREWVNREHGSLSFRLVQVLSGHGCFGRYLHRIAGREATPACHHCDCVEDTAQHTLEECPAWASERCVLVAAVGNDLSLPTVVSAMVESETSWRAVRSFCEAVISKKEAAERERERTSTLAIRQRRVRRGGRIPHALLQPP